MNPTGIAWTDITVNPLRARNLTTGAVGHYCQHAAPECASCYAESWNASTRAGRGTSLPYRPSSLDSLELFLAAKELDAVKRRRKPCKLFWCSMTDLFGGWVRDDWLDAVFGAI